MVAGAVKGFQLSAFCFFCLAVHFVVKQQQQKGIHCVFKIWFILKMVYDYQLVFISSMHVSHAVFPRHLYL